MAVIDIEAPGADKADLQAALLNLGFPRVLAHSAVAIAYTGSTSETALATISVPAGVMGANGLLRITALWSYTNSANSKTLRARLGGLAGTIYFNSGSLTTTATLRHQIEIQNRNSVSSQVGGVSNIGSQWATSTAVPVTSAIDTSAAVDLVLTGQLGNAAETITLESYLVELIRTPA